MRTCVECGTAFEGRWDAKTCSDKCRKRLSRRGSQPLVVDVSTPLAQMFARRAAEGKGKALMVPAEVSVTEQTVSEAVAAGDRLEELYAVKRRVARALDDDSTAPSALAPLARVFAEVTASIDFWEAARLQEQEDLRVVADEAWDPDAI